MPSLPQVLTNSARSSRKTSDSNVLAQSTSREPLSPMTSAPGTPTATGAGARSPTTDEPRPSPSRPTSRTPLSMYTISKLFLQFRSRSNTNSPKSHHIYSSSGTEPRTHPVLAQSQCSPRIIQVDYHDKFITTGGVDVPKLLRATRASLLKQAEYTGANALIEEQWTCDISGPRNDGSFITQIHYSASATRSEAADPHQPVALDQAKSVPGLMTIIERVS